MLPWLWIGVLCILLVGTLWIVWQWKQTPTPPEHFTVPRPSVTGNLQECTVYYTSNIDICSRPEPDNFTLTDAMIDSGASVNYYRAGSNVVANQTSRLSQMATRTAAQTSALEDLKRVLKDIDQLPFKNTCKLGFSAMKEMTAHPRKINQTYDAEQRGQPAHWSFCFYSDRDLARADDQTLVQSPVFQKVFQDTGGRFTHSSGGNLTRYDMRSMYNDDLVNLYCVMHATRVEGGQSALTVHNNRSWMEFTLGTPVLTPEKTHYIYRVQRMRPVFMNNAILYDGVPTTIPVADRAAAKKRLYLRYIETVRNNAQPVSFFHRMKPFAPTFYKVLFHLCGASAKRIETTGAELVHPNYVELVVSKPYPTGIQSLLQFTRTFSTNIYTHTAEDPLDDVQFDIAELDNKWI